MIQHGLNYQVTYCRPTYFSSFRWTLSASVDSNLLLGIRHQDQAADKGVTQVCENLFWVAHWCWGLMSDWMRSFCHSWCARPIHGHNSCSAIPCKVLPFTVKNPDFSTSLCASIRIGDSRGRQVMSESEVREDYCCGLGCFTVIIRSATCQTHNFMISNKGSSAEMESGINMQTGFIVCSWTRMFRWTGDSWQGWLRRLVCYSDFWKLAHPQTSPVMFNWQAIRAPVTSASVAGLPSLRFTTLLPPW